MTTTKNPGQIYKLIPELMKKVGPIKKSRVNEGEGGWNYRGIEDLYNKIQPVAAELGVFNTAEVQERQCEVVKTDKGKTMFWNKLWIRYRFFCEDGSSITTDGVAEGWSTSDKGSSKAMSQCHKYALFQLLMIPTDELVDSDSNDQRVDDKPPAGPPPEHPQSQQEPGKTYPGWGNTSADPAISAKYKANIIQHLADSTTPDDVKRVFLNLKGNHTTLTPTDYAICKDACSKRNGQVQPDNQVATAAKP